MITAKIGLIVAFFIQLAHDKNPSNKSLHLDLSLFLNAQLGTVFIGQTVAALVLNMIVVARTVLKTMSVPFSRCKTFPATFDDWIGKQAIT